MVIFNNFKDPRTVDKAALLIGRMIETQSPQIWTISHDRNEYESFVNVLSKPEKEGIDPIAVNESMLLEGLDHFKGKPTVRIVHDFSSIRKRYSKEMEGMGKVKSLEGDMVNGFETFNSVALSAGRLHLLSSTTIDRREDGTDLEEWETYHKKTAFAQIGTVNGAFKDAFPDQVRIHLMDREVDDIAFFEFFEVELGEKFVGRLKMNRNSHTRAWDAAKQKEVSIKVKDQEFANHFRNVYQKFIHKGKVYENAVADIFYDTMVFNKRQYWVLRVELRDRKGNPIFTDPMILITNLHIQGDSGALQVYHHYLQRSRIESVFKFLKTNLGWEDFQVRNFIAIRNILLLVFWIGAYFYERQDEQILDEHIRFICQLAKSKGKVTRHFYLKGLVVLAHYRIAQQYFNELGLSRQEIDHFLEKTKFLTS